MGDGRRVEGVRAVVGGDQACWLELPAVRVETMDDRGRGGGFRPVGGLNVLRNGLIGMGCGDDWGVGRDRICGE